MLLARSELMASTFVSCHKTWSSFGLLRRPLSANGLEMTIDKAQAELTRIKSLFRLLQDTPAVYDEWETLVAQYGVSGKNTYDARIVAAMTLHGITDLLTFNAADFKRYHAITVLSPIQVK